MQTLKETVKSIRSLPVRGAWVEMQDGFIQAADALVAPRAGSVG